MGVFMMKKNGFISITILYSFFVVFMLMLLLVISSYINSRTRLNIYKKDIKETEVRTNEDVYLKDFIVSVADNTTINYAINTSINGKANYRYVGESPKNYIRFNNELWRIISLSEETYCVNTECTSFDNTYLVKIVRNDSIGSLSWDYKKNGVGSSISDNGSNNWADSQLMMLLNPVDYYKTGYNGGYLNAGYSLEGYSVSDGTRIIYRNMGSYFNSDMKPLKPAETNTSGFNSTAEVNKCQNSSIDCMRVLSDSAQTKIVPVKWWLYGVNNIYDSNPLDLYYQERNLYDAGRLRDISYPQYWYGKVGLMYVSDVGLSALSQCYETSINSWSPTCKNGYWLSSSQRDWTLGIDSSSDAKAISSTSNGLIQSEDVRNSYGVRPVVYLKPSIRIVGNHEGTASDPFIIE